MGALVSDDDVVRLTAAAALTCGQVVQVPDGRAGIVQNMKPVAIGEVATCKVEGIMALVAGADLTAGAKVGVHLVDQEVLAAGAAGTIVAGTLLYTVTDGSMAYVALGEPTENVSIGASTAAAGSVTGDAGVLPAATAKFYPTSAADGTKGVRLHADDAVTGRRIYVGNGVSNAILKVYPPTGGTINGAAANAAFSSVSGKGVILICVSGSGNTWSAF